MSENVTITDSNHRTLGGYLTDVQDFWKLLSNEVLVIESIKP
jgi:hypothetical protein